MARHLSAGGILPARARARAAKTVADSPSENEGLDNRHLSIYFSFDRFYAILENSQSTMKR